LQQVRVCHAAAKRLPRHRRAFAFLPPLLRVTSQSKFALLPPQSALCCSLIKSLNLAGFIQYFVVIFSKFKFQSLLIGEVPIIICNQ
jgi:hypothetical protein